MKLSDIIIRDPFILRNDRDKTYYLYGTTTHYDGQGFYCYTSKDLVTFKGPFKIFTPPKDFWAKKHFWAPEVYFINNKYYLLATFKADNHVRSCQMLVSDSPRGPFIIHSDILTPPNYEALDATLCFDEDEKPYIIFCHEWLQIDIGTICKQYISKDFKNRIGDPILLFKGTDAKWVSTKVNFSDKEVCITDGPFLYERSNQRILLWSSFINKEDYSVGYAKLDKKDKVICHSETSLPIIDGGHCMVFTSFDNKDYLIFHTNNKKGGKETAKILPININKKGEIEIER
ncbi:MAG TPA: glycoside hydrolase family 43 protein [Candidatus Paceibacterota bacterium]|jgi:arabinan endo-1,5-alpha-L-arabinosidase|nr:glycoside hydrolase family 43 protein [Candidatus Paceibacterota bacterium]